MNGGTHRASAEELAPIDPRELRAALLVEIAAGARLVTFYGRPDGDGVRLTAVTQGPTGALRVRRARVERERGLHAATEVLPAFHVFEREIHEQHGVRFPGHPWLKPVRFQGAPAGATDAYPFYAVKGKEVHEVQVGPVHAGVIEPGAFRFACHGEQVLHLEIHLGYQHRGVEALLLGRDPRALGPWVETIAGDTSVGHAWAWAAALEDLAGAPATEAAERSRAVMLELERVAMHLAGLSGLATDIAHLQGATTWGRLRTTVINTAQRLCGSRFGRTAVRPGQNRVALDPTTAGPVRAALDLLQADLATIEDRFVHDPTARARLQGVGRVPTALATSIGLVGQAARASGIALDQRAFRRGIWARAPIDPVVEPDGDCWARARVRMRELTASLAWLRAALDGGWDAPITRGDVGPLAPEALVISVVEGWRGEVVHALETDARGALVHYKVQDPSLRNWLGLALAVRGEEISDFPICNKSFDLSYCGNDL